MKSWNLTKFVIPKLDFWGNQQNCLYAVIEKDAYTLGQFTDFEVSFTFA